MPRLFKKFYIFAIFIFGIFFYAVVKNTALDGSGRGPPNPSRDKLDNTRGIILKHLDNLEGEIKAQKEYSNALLNKLKQKYSTSSFPKKTLTSKELLGKGSSDRQLEADKLLALQKVLQQEEHPGEVHSDIDIKETNDIEGGKNHNHHHQKDKDQEDFVNGEVIDEADGKKVATLKDDGSVIAIVVFVCDRPSVKRCLEKLFAYRPSEKKFPIIVSQDCGSHSATTEILRAYDGKITHIMQPDLSEIYVPPKEKKMKGYFKIARHYGWALNHTFNKLGYDNVIIVEDDLEIAPDFFEYFAATLPILRRDPALWCVSAWNDNGKPHRINETASDLLYRSDFFPGLGWMMTKDLWKELMVKWPRGYWDDWMREPAQRRNRVCIRPEISRTSTFGKEGVSLGTYYMNHLRYIKLNQHFVPFTSLDLSYLLKDNYDVEFVHRVYSSQLASSVPELMSLTSETPKNPPQEYRLVYRSNVDFRLLAKKLELMDDTKAGVPRTAYRGVVPFFLNGHRCYLAPGANWESYQLT